MKIIQEFEEKCRDLISEKPNSTAAREGGRCGNATIPDNAFLSSKSAEKPPATEPGVECDLYGAGQTYKRHNPFEKLSGTFNIKQHRTIDNKMLVSQHLQDSKAPDHLAQFKHETDYKHCLERWNLITVFTFSYNGRHVDSFKQKQNKKKLHID